MFGKTISQLSIRLTHFEETCVAYQKLLHYKLLLNSLHL